MLLQPTRGVLQLLLLGSLTACYVPSEAVQLRDQDAGNQPPADGGTITGQGPYCSIAREIFGPKCTSCHQPGGTWPDLSYEGAKAGLVGVVSRTFAPAILVAAGDAQGSLLYRKVAGAQAPNEGAAMPSAAPLSAGELSQLAGWIDSGASFECTNPGNLDGGTGATHPEGFVASSVHGVEAKLGAQDCRSCHGLELTGVGNAPSCDGCHTAGWRTSCTYCHGGTLENSGAPPRDLNGVTERDQLTFRAHQEHLKGTVHPAYDCTECHVKPTDVLSPNHVFDSTPGRADVTFGGLSSQGQYAGSGQCNNLYCHGTGRASNGNIDHTSGPLACDACHPGPNSSLLALVGMSGAHRKHRSEGVACVECHAGTINDGNHVSDPSLHVNGTKDVVFQGSVTRSTSGTCSGTCHEEGHNNRRW